MWYAVSEPRTSYSTLIIGAILLIVPLTSFFTPAGDIMIDRVSGDVSNSGIQTLEDVSDIHFIGLYNDGIKSGLGSSMGLKDIDGDGFDDVYFGYGLLPGNSGLVAYKGGPDHVRGQVDLETVEPDISYSFRCLSLDTGDINDDGQTDLIIGGYKGSGSVLSRIGENEFQSYMIPAGGPEDPLNFQYADHVLLDDLDGDGMDEAVGGYFYNNPYSPNPPPHSVTIRWSGGGITTITQGRYQMLGTAIASGDIDGDGNQDLIIGCFAYDDEDRNLQEPGSVFIYFNASKLKGNSTLNPRFTADCWIVGSSVEDFFGYSIKVIDLDSDGKDDLIIGSPGSDDPMNTQYNTGALHVFYGDIEASFPSNMESNSGADLIVYGATGKYSGNPDYSGDGLGRVFEIADIDGDMQYELVVGLKGWHTTDNSVHRGDFAGAVTIHETSEAFPGAVGRNKLSYPSKIFTVEGSDPIDSSGWQVDTGDINGDGIADILISVPGGDGIDNERAQCGEVFLVLGRSLRIEGMEISGGSFRNGWVIPSNGDLVMNITFYHTKGPELVKQANITLDHNGADIEIIIDDQGIRVLNDKWDSVRPVSSSRGQRGFRGWMECIMEFEINVPLKGPVDVDIRLLENDGSNTTFSLPGLMKVSKSYEYASRPLLETESRALDHRWEWVREDLDITIEIPDVKNVHGGSVLEPGRMGFMLKNAEGNNLDSAFKQGVTMSFSSNSIPDELRITPALDPLSFPNGYPERYLPELPDEIPIDLRLDNEIPDAPNELTVSDRRGSNDDGLIASGEVEINVNGTLGPLQDNNGSGIDRFEIGLDDGEFQPLMESGGLMGYYYSNRNFADLWDMFVDERIDFDWEEFGPAPRYLLYNDFSIEWKGWFYCPWDFPTGLRVYGEGSVRVLIDGSEVLPFSDIRTPRLTRPLDLEEGTYHKISVQFRNHPSVISTSITLEWLEEDGRYWRIEPSYLYHSVDRMNITLEEDYGSLAVFARSVDSVGHYSETITTTISEDSKGPVFEPLMVPEWTPSTEPEVSVGIEDVSSSGGPGVGVDPDSVMYSFISLTGEEEEWREIKTFEGDDGLEISFSPVLDDDFKGSIIFYAEDLLGNPSTSPRYPLNVDTKGPGIQMLGERTFELDEGEYPEMTLRVKDIGGSGVDGQTLSYRYRTMESDIWPEWRQFGNGEYGEDITVSDSVMIDNGQFEMEFMVKDLVGNTALSDIYIIQVKTRPVDEPPVPSISSPENGTTIIVGEPLVLDATGTTDDDVSGKGLVLTWFSNRSGYLLSGGRGSVYLDVGVHNIILYADDGNPDHNISTGVTVTVLDPSGNGNGSGGGGGREDPPETEDDGNLTWMIVIALITFLGLVAGLVYMFMKSRDQDDFQIGIREISDDDEVFDEEEYRGL